MATTWKCERCGWEGEGAEGCGTHGCNPRDMRFFDELPDDPPTDIPKWALISEGE